MANIVRFTILNEHNARFKTKLQLISQKVKQRKGKGQKRIQAKSPAGNKQIHRGKQAHNLLYVPSLPFT